MASKTKIERALERAQNSRAAMQRRMKEREGAVMRGAGAIGSGFALGAAEKKWPGKLSIAGIGAIPLVTVGAGVGSLLTKNKTAQNVLEGVASGTAAIGAYKVGKGERLSPEREREESAEGVQGAPPRQLPQRTYVQPRAIEGGPRRRRRRASGDALEELIDSLEERIEGGEFDSYEDALDAAE